MPKLDLGPVGIALGTGQGDDVQETTAELDHLGYSAIWLTGAVLNDLDVVRTAVRATHQARVVTGILAADRFAADEVAALYGELETAHPGRFIAGLGGAHGPKPLGTLSTYLDHLDAADVPAERRLLAALGPRMLRLARDRSAGAVPVLVTPEYTEGARAELGDDSTLAVQQMVVLDTDPGRAREVARGPLRFLSQVPGYPQSFRRMGFDDGQIADLADPLVDALVAWGDLDAVVARVRDHQAAGADHVALMLVGGEQATPPSRAWRDLAEALSVA